MNDIWNIDDSIFREKAIRSETCQTRSTVSICITKLSDDLDETCLATAACQKNNEDCGSGNLQELAFMSDMSIGRLGSLCTFAFETTAYDIQKADLVAFLETFVFHGRVNLLDVTGTLMS